MLQRNTLSSLHLFWEASRSPVTQLGLSNALSEGALFPPDPFSSPPLEPGLHWVNFSLLARYKKKSLFFFCWVVFNPPPPLAAAKLYGSIKGQSNYGKRSEHLFLEVPTLLFAGLGDIFDTCQLPPLCCTCIQGCEKSRRAPGGSHAHILSVPRSATTTKPLRIAEVALTCNLTG